MTRERGGDERKKERVGSRLASVYITRCACCLHGARSTPTVLLFPGTVFVSFPFDSYFLAFFFTMGDATPRPGGSSPIMMVTTLDEAYDDD